MNKEYLLYLIRSKKHLSIFILIVSMLPTLLYILSSPVQYYSFSHIEMILCVYIVIVICESFILPFVYFGYLQSKRALDTYYNIPIARTKLVITNFVHMSTQIIVFGIIGTIIPFLINLSFLPRPYMIVVLYALTSLFGIIVSLFVLAIIYKTNTLFDSVILSVAYITIPFLIVTVLSTFDIHQIYGLTNTFGWITPHIILPVTCLAPLLYLVSAMNSAEMVFSLQYFLLILEAIIIGFGCFISIRRDIKKRKAELSETVSSNFFAWPLAIGLTTMCLLFIFAFSIDDTMTMIIWFAFVFVAYLIMTFVYRRKIVFTKRDLLLFGVGIFASLTILAVAEATDGFYLSRAYRSIDSVENFDIYSYITIQNDSTPNDTYDLYNKMTMEISDKEAVDDIIALADRLYDRYKSGEDYYLNEGYIGSCYIDMHFIDDKGRQFSFYHQFYINDDKDIDDFKEIVGLVDEIGGMASATVYSDIDGYISKEVPLDEVESIVDGLR